MDLHQFDLDRRTATTSSGPISYVDTGAADGDPGRVALFVHGVATNAYLWRHAIAELRDDFRCIALDLPLHGQSPLAAGQDVSLPALAGVVEALCVALDLPLHGIDLVANDTGGAIAQLFAVRHPERLRTFTLTNCDTQDNLPPENFKPTVDLAKAGELAPTAPALAADWAATRDLVLASSFEHPEQISPELVGAYLAPVIGTEERARGFERILAAMDADDLRAIEPKLRTLDVPTLLLWGTDDIMFPMADAEWLRDTLPNVTALVPIEGAHLFWPEERGPELADHLRKHWAA